MRGFINIYKPEGISSATVVNAVKRKLHTPCGHMGTLDPMAEGILPVGLGKTSRLFPYLLGKTKTYIAEFTFGYETDTLDITGTVTETGGRIPNIGEIREKLKYFVGEIEQIPPKYSAKCINGKRGYQLARKGVDFELEPRKVNICEYELLDKTCENSFSFKIVCKGGTYIRSLARDLGSMLGTFAVMSKLQRKESGVFTVENCVSFEEFKNADNAEKFILPSDFAVDFPKLVLKDKTAMKILNGVFDNIGVEDGVYRVYNGEEFWGVGHSEKGVVKIDAYVR